MVVNDMINIIFLPTIWLNFACVDPLCPPTALDLLFIYLENFLPFSFFLSPMLMVPGPAS